MAHVLTPGRVSFADAWDLQKALLRQRIDGAIPDTVIVCEHDPVYTVGRKRDATANLLAVGDTPVFEVERGGDVTWHGPGQVVVYPIVALEGPARDLHAYLRRLEDLMIDVCAEHGLVTGRDPRNTGAWSDGRKLGSVGVACRRWVTWHGLALNVDPDLGWFSRINPCGFPAAIMTSLAAELARPVERAAVEASFVRRLRDW